MATQELSSGARRGGGETSHDVRGMGAREGEASRSGEQKPHSQTTWGQTHCGHNQADDVLLGLEAGEGVRH